MVELLTAVILGLLMIILGLMMIKSYDKKIIKLLELLLIVAKSNSGREALYMQNKVKVYTAGDGFAVEYRNGNIEHLESDENIFYLISRK